MKSAIATGFLLGSVRSSEKVYVDSRASMWWQLGLIDLLRSVAVGNSHWHTDHALKVFIVKFSLFVIVSPAARSTTQVTPSILPIEDALVRVDGGKIVSSIDRRGRVGNQMVSYVRKSSLHAVELMHEAEVIQLFSEPVVVRKLSEGLMGCKGSLAAKPRDKSSPIYTNEDCTHPAGIQVSKT
jgi:hypothetical protein